MMEKKLRKLKRRDQVMWRRGRGRWKEEPQRRMGGISLTKACRGENGRRDGGRKEKKRKGNRDPKAKFTPAQSPIR